MPNKTAVADGVTATVVAAHIDNCIYICGERINTRYKTAVELTPASQIGKVQVNHVKAGLAQ